MKVQMAEKLKIWQLVKADMTLEGQSLIGAYPIKNPLYKSTDCVAVVQWSAEGVAAANQSQSEMNNTSSSSSGSQQSSWSRNHI